MRGVLRTTKWRFVQPATVVVVAIVAIMNVVPSAAAPRAASPLARTASDVVGWSGEKGLHFFALSGRTFGVSAAIHVLTIKGSAFQVKIALADRAIDKGVQTPSAMCRATKNCVAAVNGDFFNLTRPGASDPGDEVGGIIQNCVLLHTPEISHQQVNLNGPSVSEGLNWSANVDVNGVNVPITAINQELPMNYVGVRVPLTGTLLFTSPYGLRTPIGRKRVTLVFDELDHLGRPTRINSTVELKLVARTKRPTKVRAGRVYISTSTASPLSALQAGHSVVMTTTSTAGCNNIGGHPILLDDGVASSIVPADTYMVKPYARTAIGWTASGVTVIMTVDGRDGVSGATANQLIGIFQALGVVTALDLDGGNSTTFYARGRILNHPSHGTERPVSTGLLVVRSR